MTLDELVVEIGAKVKKGEWTDVFSLLDHVKRMFDETFGKLGEAAEKALDTVIEMASHTDDMATMAEQYGLTASELEGLGWAAKMSDAEMSDLTIGMRAFANVSAQAAGGSAEAAESLRGIAGKGVVDRLMSAADVFSKMEQGQKKTALAAKLFGRSGATLIPLLNRGSEGVKALMGQFEASGAAASKAFSEQADVLDDTLKEYQMYREALKMRFSAVGVEGATKLYKALISLLKSGGAKKAVDMLANIFGRASYAAGVFAGWLAKLLDIDGASEVALFGLAAAFGTVTVAALTAGAAAISAAAAVVGAWAVTLWPILAIGVVLALVADEISTFVDGGESLLGDFWAWFNSPDIQALGIVEVFRDLTNLVTTLWGLFSGGAGRAGAFFSDLYQWIKPGLLAAFSAQLKALSFAFHSIDEAVRLVSHAIQGLFLLMGKIGELGGAAFGAIKGKVEHVVSSVGTPLALATEAATAIASAPVQTGPTREQATATAPSNKTSVQINAPISVTAPSNADPVWLKQTESTMRQAVRDELGSVLQDTYAAHGGGR